MMDYILVPIILIIIAVIIFLNVFLKGKTIDNAFEKNILPDLKSNGLTFLRSEPTGFFGYGDFRAKDVESSPFIVLKGDPRNVIFTYIYYKNPNTPETQRVTVMIDTVFFSVRKVTYSRPLTEIKKNYPEDPYTRIHNI